MHCNNIDFSFGNSYDRNKAILLLLSRLKPILLLVEEIEMDIRYVIKKLPENISRMPLIGEFIPEQIPQPWSSLDEAMLASNPWLHLDSDYMPNCAARVGWNAAGIHVLMYAEEPFIRAQETTVGGNICQDSCLEFFLAPNEEKVKYINCEANPLAIMHIGLGDGRYGRSVFTEIPAGFEPVSSQHAGRWWAVSYTIPANFLQEHFDCVPHSGAHVRGNFYKCGDRERHIHHLMLHPYDIEKPDYHRPELFADMILE